MRCRVGSEQLNVGMHSACTHNAKDWMMQRFLFKVGERGLRSHVKVWLDKRDALRFFEKLFEDGCCLSRLKLDDSDWLRCDASV